MGMKVDYPRAVPEECVLLLDVLSLRCRQALARKSPDERRDIANRLVTRGACRTAKSAEQYLRDLISEVTDRSFGIAFLTHLAKVLDVYPQEIRGFLLREAA